MISDIIWRYDVNAKGEHVGTYISPVADRMLGLPDGSIGNRFDKYLSYVHPDDLPSVQKLLSEGIRMQGTDKTAEYRLRKADGTTIWVRSRCSAYSQPDGRISVFGTTSDITERVRAEEALRDANQFNIEIVSQAGEGIIVYDRNLRYVAWNKFMERMTGALAEDVLGRKALDLFPHLSETGVDNLLNRALNGETVTSPDIPFYSTFEDQKGWVVGTYAPHRNARGEIIGVIATLRDITERKRVEEAHRAASAYSRSLIEASLDPMATIGLDGKITDVNAATEAATGYSRRDLVGTDFSNYFTEPDNARAGYRRIFQEGSVRDYALSIRRRDGHITPVLYNASVYRDDAGNILGVFAAARDITERERAEDELRWNAALLEAQVESSLDGILVVDCQGRRIITNQRLRTMWKVPQSIVDEEDDQALLQYVADKIKNPDQFLEKVLYLYDHPDETSRDEIEFKDGMVMDRYSSPVIGRDGKHYGRIWTFRDITDHKRAEDALRESEQRLADIIDFLPDATFAVDENGKGDRLEPGYGRDDRRGQEGHDRARRSCLHNSLLR